MSLPAWSDWSVMMHHKDAVSPFSPEHGSMIFVAQVNPLTNKAHPAQVA